MANLLKRERERLVETVGFASMRCMSIWYFPAGAGVTQTISLENRLVALACVVISNWLQLTTFTSVVLLSL